MAFFKDITTKAPKGMRELTIGVSVSACMCGCVCECACVKSVYTSFHAHRCMLTHTCAHAHASRATVCCDHGAQDLGVAPSKVQAAPQQT